MVELDYAAMKTSAPKDVAAPILVGASRNDGHGLAVLARSMGRGDRDTLQEVMEMCQTGWKEADSEGVGVRHLPRSLSRLRAWDTPKAGRASRLNS